MEVCFKYKTSHLHNNEIKNEKNILLRGEKKLSNKWTSNQKAVNSSK